MNKDDLQNTEMYGCSSLHQVTEESRNPVSGLGHDENFGFLGRFGGSFVVHSPCPPPNPSLSYLH